jgi:hypothetical protein
LESWKTCDLDRAGKFGVLGHLVQMEDVAMAGLLKKQIWYQVEASFRKEERSVETSRLAVHGDGDGSS